MFDKSGRDYDRQISVPFLWFERVRYNYSRSYS